jgi:multidrug resistance efflux pump
MKRFFVLIVLMAFGCDTGTRELVRVTGQIEGNAVTAGSRIGGRVLETPAREGDRVAAGDVLIRLEDDEARAAVAAAQAALAAAEATLQKIETGATPEQLRQAEAAAEAAREQYQLVAGGARAEEIRAARAALDGARAQRDTTENDFRRIERLFAEGAASQRQLDQARLARDTAEAQYQAALEKHRMLAEGARAEEIGMARAAFDRAQAALDEMRIGAREEDRAAARAARDAAAADLSRAEAALREMTVTAPIAGLLESLDARPGDLLKPGPAVRIIDPDDLELKVYVSATLLGYLEVGQEIALTTDAHGDERFRGRIIQLATQGEYTPRNLQTEEERVQQVFGVKIALDLAGGKLRAGMTATALMPSPASLFGID